MNNVAIATAKLAGIHKAVSSLLSAKDSRGLGPKFTWQKEEVEGYFISAEKQRGILSQEMPQLFDEIAPLNAEARPSANPIIFIYTREQLERLVTNIDQVFEIRANSEIGQPIHTPEAKRRVFISHGRAPDWREVQSFIERDIRLSTIELAQEASGGMTIIEKLFNNAEMCDSAVIVMTGDDKALDGQTRSRENVMHEIGFFQGKYGRRNVILLHEDSVSIPTNLSGIVYIPFPKDMITAGFHVLQRELKALYPGL